MSFLFAHSKKKNIPEITGLQIQTAVNVLPIPIVYGSPRIPMNIIYANGFHADAVKSSSSSGKGLLSGGKGSTTTGYKYYATFIGALGEGEITNIAVVFDDQMTYTPATIPPGKSMTAFTGTPTQAPWNAILTQWPNDAFGYKDTAYIGFNNYLLDSTATIPQLNFVAVGKFAATCPLNRYIAPDASGWLFDADPAECIFDLLTNTTYGVGFPTAYIDQTTLFTSPDGENPLVGDAALSTYAQAVGFGWSVVLNNAEPASSILDRWCKNLVVAPVWTGTLLKFIPYCDTFNGNNPGYATGFTAIPLKYYKPNTTVLFSLTDDDFQQTDGTDDPVIAMRVDVAEVKNTVRLNFRDRYNLFNDNVMEAKDELTAELYGPRTERMGPADEFTHGIYAGQATQLQLQRNISIRRTFTFKLDQRWCILEPMDVIAISDTVLGLNQFTVRIREISEDEKGILTFICEEFPVGAGAAIAYGRQNNEPPSTLQTNIAAPAVNPPAIFEPTSALLTEEGQAGPIVYIGACGGPSGTFDPNWGGCNVWLSLDDISYTQSGFLVGPTVMGVTTNTFPAYTGTNPDDTNSLQIDLTESNGTTDSFTDAQALGYQSLAAIVDPDGSYELIAYTQAVLTSAHNYTLTRIYRGLLGTRICSHSAGALFVKIKNSPIEALTLPPQFIGVPIYVKLQSFNIFSLGVEDISACTAYLYTPAGFGLSATGPLAIALQDLSTDEDLNTFPNDSLDLGSGVMAGDCAPVNFFVDLGAF